MRPPAATALVLLAGACASRAPSPRGESRVIIAEAPEPEPEPEQAPTIASATTVPAPDRGCFVPSEPQPERSAGGLTIPTLPAKRRFEMKGRLRTHTDGPLSRRGRRVWVGPPVPSFVPLAFGTLELFVLDPIPNGYFALYRDPYDASSCTLGGHANCAFEVVAFDCSGSAQFHLDLGPFLSRKDHLEVQDAQMDGRVVYFNEACQSYSAQAKGKCSSLVALDPLSATVKWRTKPLVSNNRFLLDPSYVVTGYGFTAEPDFVYVVSRSDGRVVHTEAIPSAHEDLYDWQGALIVELSETSALVYRRHGFDGASPSLERWMPLEKSPTP